MGVGPMGHHPGVYMVLMVFITVTTTVGKRLVVPLSLSLLWGQEQFKPPL